MTALTGGTPTSTSSPNFVPGAGPVEDPPLQRIMAIYAHPDDPEFFSGGLLAKFAAEGKALTYVLATSGDKGSDDPEMTAARLMETREAEQRAAAKCMGSDGDNVIFLCLPDGELFPTLELRRDLTRLIRLHRPDVVITNDPTTFYFKAGGINHPDHRAIGTAVLDAVYPTARDRHNMVELWRDEGLEPHKVRRVYLAGTLNPNVRIDISSVLDRKIAAILEHRSQVKDAEALIKRQRDNKDTEFGDQEIYTEAYRVIMLR